MVVSGSLDTIGYVRPGVDLCGMYVVERRDSEEVERLWLSHCGGYSRLCLFR